MWTFLFRFTAVLAACDLVKRLFDDTAREIKPNRLYALSEAARFLCITREELHRLIEEGKVNAKQSRDGFMIVGQTLLDYIRR